MERFVVPGPVLWSHPEEAVVHMRLGALANAIMTVSGIVVGSMGTGAGRERDLVQTILLIASYFKEAVDAINTKSAWRLIEAGAKAGYRLPLSIARLKELYSRDEGSLYKRGVYDVRRRKGSRNPCRWRCGPRRR